MATGLSATNYATVILNLMHRGVTPTVPPGNFIKLHTGDPGSAGTTNPSSVTTRPSATFSAPTGTGPVQIALSNTPTWASWAGTNGESVSHISEWDASTAGNFKDSAALTTPKTVNTGDTLSLASFSISYAPIAA